MDTGGPARPLEPDLGKNTEAAKEKIRADYLDMDTIEPYPGEVSLTKDSGQIFMEGEFAAGIKAVVYTKETHPDTIFFSKFFQDGKDPNGVRHGFRGEFAKSKNPQAYAVLEDLLLKAKEPLIINFEEIAETAKTPEELKMAYLEMDIVPKEHGELKLNGDWPMIFAPGEYEAGVRAVIFVKKEQPDRVYYHRFCHDSKTSLRHGRTGFFSEKNDPVDFKLFKKMLDGMEEAMGELRLSKAETGKAALAAIDEGWDDEKGHAA